MQKKGRLANLVIILTIILIQTLLYVFVASKKEYIHMDEAYSYGLTNYDRVNIYDNEDFYDTWHDNDYYKDYLVIDEDEVNSYKQVYENQKNDVHPPFYYLLLRLMMNFSVGNFSIWPGIILNIIIYSICAIFTYLICLKIFKEKVKAGVIALISQITLASITNVIYIRMYALTSLWVLVTTYLHLLLLDSKKVNYKLLTAIGISSLLGSLTHYYYLFYLFTMFIIFVVKYSKEKRYQELKSYIGTLVIAGIISILIFPYSIKHLFFGYRGQGALSKLLNVSSFLISIGAYLWKLNYYMFNFTLIIISLILLIYKLKKRIILPKNNYIRLMIIPTIVFFILVSLSSPWLELRYILPISQIIFIIIMYYWDSILKVNKNYIYVLIVIILGVPIIFNLKPEVLYEGKEQVVNEIKNTSNVPALYYFNSNNNRFLDDIYLFSIIDKSYIAKDLELNEDNIKNILSNIDLNNGLYIFINDFQDNNTIINLTKEVTNLENVKHVARLNITDLYYLYN